MANNTEDDDEDVNLLLEMAAEAEAAWDPTVIPLPLPACPGAIEAKASAALPETVCNKRRASTSPSAADVTKKARHTETPKDTVLDKTEAGSKAEHPSSKLLSAAFQPASGKHARGLPEQVKKPLSNEKAMEKHSGLMVS